MIDRLAEVVNLKITARLTICLTWISQNQKRFTKGTENHLCVLRANSVLSVNCFWFLYKLVIG
jgi:hypothetical protein